MSTKTKRLLTAVIFSTVLAGSAKADLAERINGIVSQAPQNQVQFSIQIVKGDSGETVYSHNANTPMVPASNMKIITTAAALKYLGPGYEYKTKVGLCGDTLVIIGSGDPLLGDKETDDKYGRKAGWIFENISAALKQNQRTVIKDIIIDSSIFDDQRVHPNWPREQLNREYACEVSGLNFNGNCVEITAKNTADKVDVTVEPRTNYVRIINEVVPIKKGKGAVGAYRNEEPNKLLVKGKCKDQQGPFAVAIERPAVFFGYLLAENLANAGIKMEGQLVEKKLDRDCNFTLLAEHTTSMADCIARCNKDSFGLAAESLLKTIAANGTPDRKYGSWTEGRNLVSRYLLELGIETSEFYIDDASGLSRENKLSANAVTRVLFDMYKSKNWQLYRDSLAVGGIDGTTSRYFKEQKYKGKIFGKTGYISGTKSFSGVCSTAGGEYIFSILTNNANDQTRKAINDITKAIIDN